MPVHSHARVPCTRTGAPAHALHTHGCPHGSQNRAQNLDRKQTRLGDQIWSPENGRKNHAQTGEHPQWVLMHLALGFAPVFRAQNEAHILDQKSEKKTDSDQGPYTCRCARARTNREKCAHEMPMLQLNTCCRRRTNLPRERCRTTVRHCSINHTQQLGIAHFVFSDKLPPAAVDLSRGRRRSKDCSALLHAILSRRSTTHHRSAISNCANKVPAS